MKTVMMHKRKIKIKTYLICLIQINLYRFITADFSFPIFYTREILYKLLTLKQLKYISSVLQVMYGTIIRGFIRERIHY